MNRATSRKMNKKVKQKLTDEQFKKFTAEAQLEYIKEEVDRRTLRVIKDIIALLPEVLRENRISEQRVEKILQEFTSKFKNQYAEVRVDEGLPE
ncbi:MAG: hypothetical protein AB6733_00115 [Clostridiaceae bacterium]